MAGISADSNGAPAAAAATAAAASAEVPLGGPSSPVLDVLFCLLPVAFLLTVTLSKRLVREAPATVAVACMEVPGSAPPVQPAVRLPSPCCAKFMPTARSLPCAAAMMWVIKMCWIGADPIAITATIMQGALLGLTPLSILFSAFVFFNALTATQAGVPPPAWTLLLVVAAACPCSHCCSPVCGTTSATGTLPHPSHCTQTMPYIAALVRAACRNHPVAEIMLVLWALGHLIEGASGFGTGPAMLPRESHAQAHGATGQAPCRPCGRALRLRRHPSRLQPSLRRWGTRHLRAWCACSS